GVTVRTGPGNDLVFVQGTRADAPTLVQTGGGDDDIEVSSNPTLTLGTLDTLAGPLTIDAGAGSNRLVISEAALQGADKVWVTAQAVTGTQVPFRVFYRAT